MQIASFSHKFSAGLGSSQSWLFQTWLLQFLCGSALLRSFAPCCALLRSFADLRLRSLALICALLHSFACFYVRQPHLGTAEGFAEKPWKIIAMFFNERIATLPCFENRNVFGTQSPCAKHDNLASVGVGLCQFSVAFAHLLGWEVETHQCI